MRVLGLFSLVLATCAVACGGSSGATTDGGGPAAEAGAPAAMTDKDHCDRACATLIACGVQYDATCSAGCLQAPVFLACIKSSPSECNALALCTFRQASSALCGSATAGVPAGTGTCAQAAQCDYNCGAQGAGIACNCRCWAAMAPVKAINLLINSQCALARCPAQCGPGGNGPACNACVSTGVCMPQNQQCLAN